MLKLIILNIDVNFNYKQIDKNREETNVSVDVNMRTSIVMEKLKPDIKNSLYVLISISLVTI